MSLSESLQRLNLHPNTYIQMRKSVILGTCSTVRNVLTLRLLISYIHMEHLFLMFLDHTQRRSTVGRTPLDE